MRNKLISALHFTKCGAWILAINRREYPMERPFKPEFYPADYETSCAAWFLFQNGRVLVNTNGNRPRIPEAEDLAHLPFLPERKHILGTLDGRLCCAADLNQGDVIPEGFETKNVRALFGELDDRWMETAGLANQILDWDRTHRYCGKCGHPMQDKRDERAKICRQCGLLNYPRLSPAVIVAVLREDRILLARNKQFRLPFYSVLAGFVEPGETLEACAKREVHEEVGITIQNLSYFHSQPWPYPNSLMIGFIADYAGGEIRVDQSEIVEAAWYSKYDLPRIPPKISIARRLIDTVLDL